MKKIYYILLVCLIIVFPTIIKAEECDIDKISIISMEQIDIVGNTEVNSEPIYQDKNIKLDLKMYHVGDSISYSLDVKNDSNEDYMIDDDTFKTDSDYIEYSLLTNDNSNVVKSKSAKHLTLVITYKKEIDDNLFQNNKFNALNSLTLSMNTKEEEKKLDIITTDNIKKSIDPVKTSNEVTNPLTNSVSLKIIIVSLLTVSIIIILILINKKKYNKYLIVLFIILMPVVYAVCKCDIEVEANIEIEKLPKLFDTVVSMSKEENSCISEYTGEVTDEVGKTVTATNVYFNRCRYKRNIVFGGFCWQMIRTTETGGIKMIYNGEVDSNGQCDNNRGRQKGLIGSYSSETNLTTEYLYGDSYTYDLELGKFTLVDTFTGTWSDDNYQKLLGKYTCLSSDNTCNSIYYVNGYKTDSLAYTNQYNIGETYHTHIGISPYNSSYYYIGSGNYMTNDVYKRRIRNSNLDNHKYANDFTYDVNSGKYTLDGDIVTINTWSSEYSSANSHRYTCFNSSGVCDKLAYIYTANIEADYLLLTDGMDVKDLLDATLNNNGFDSSIKGEIDAWFKHNLLDYSPKIENTVFCNNREVANYNGWNTRDEFGINKIITFENESLPSDLKCSDINDQLSISNDKAKLKYPIALFSIQEMVNLGTNSSDDNLRMTGYAYWTLSPGTFSGSHLYMRRIGLGGSFNVISTVEPFHVRPAISIKNALFTEGDGSTTNPWVIK